MNTEHHSQFLVSFGDRQLLQIFFGMHIVDIATSWNVLKHVETTNQIQNSGWPFFVVESTLERQVCFQQQEWTWNVHELGPHIGATGFNIWRMQEGTPNYDKLVFK